ncbi:RNA--NAD 2'-phosphotransferase [Pseudomonas sp. DTU12.3]|uniref:RNA 2'-phosphotransferase n=1 Tax=Pseudomonas sp. DTU12.3 TaxID=2073078 RepID=UPI0010128382|nr:RNA 2'-phosphotransferase [Pseudomonas sp. DTU12.3]QAX84768.1 RNA--NAD 2'-phosphotransferase [Pseudomonas sp. DTU12.3]
MNKKQLTHISKFLSFVLRHNPKSIDIQLDSEGWTLINDIIEGAEKQGLSINKSQILSILELSEKKRFAVSDDETKIRALQGHTTSDVDIAYAEKIPPEFLYHGTAKNFLRSILKDGLIPGSRQYVHLTQDLQSAIAVGGRHGSPIALKINALEMHRNGVHFYQAENGVWLTKKVHPTYILNLTSMDHP